MQYYISGLNDTYTIIHGLLEPHCRATAIGQPFIKIAIEPERCKLLLKI
jgi:hypothetical protein